MKKIVSVIALILSLSLVLCACSNSSAPKSNAPASNPPVSSGSPTDAPQYTETYNLTFAVMDNEGGVWDQLVVQPLVKMLDEYSNGRIKVEVYYSATIAGQGTILDAIDKGLCDMGVDILVAYQGLFPYADLNETPGVDFGSAESFTRLAADYYKEFPEKNLEKFVVLGQYSSGTMGLLTRTSVTTVDELKGLSTRGASGVNAYISALGASPVSMPTSEVYEALKLNVIQATTCAVSRIDYSNFWEQATYYIPMPWINGMQFVLLSREVYDSMDPEAQAAIDRTTEEFVEVGVNYAKTADAQCIESIKKDCPDFVFTELTPEAKQEFLDIAAAGIEEKAAKMDAAGKRGTEALQWIRDNAQKYYTPEK